MRGRRTLSRARYNPSRASTCSRAYTPQRAQKGWLKFSISPPPPLGHCGMRFCGMVWLVGLCRRLNASMPQAKLRASRPGATPAPRQTTSLRRLSKVPNASKSVFGVRKNPSWAQAILASCASSARRPVSGRRDRLFGVPKPREIDASADVTCHHLRARKLESALHWKRRQRRGRRAK